MDEKQLKTKKKPELVELCRQKKLPVSGRKEELIARLLGRPKPKAAAPAKKSKVVEPYSKPVFDLVMRTRPSVVILMNDQGNFEHKDTGLVFNKETKKVIGKQIGERVENLKISDLEICRENGFRVDENCVDKEFEQDKTNRLEQLAKFMQDEDAEETDEEEEPEDEE